MLELYYPILAAVTANVTAQAVKAVYQIIKHRSFSPSVVFSSGGMPSSHAATITALTLAIGLQEGFHSSIFALSFIVACVVAYDAMGVRHHAGRHAAALNTLVEDFRQLKEIAQEAHQDTDFYDQKFKELLGHNPLEVGVGVVYGVLVAVALHWWL